MRVVIDTNTLLVSIGRKSMFRPIFDAFLSGNLQLLLTNEILSEYIERLAENTSPIVAENIAKLLTRSPDVERVDVYFKWNLIVADADDNKFVDCALNGQADYIVTDDRHFNILRRIGFPPVKVVRTEEFSKMLTAMNG